MPARKRVIEAIEAGQGYRAASIDASESEDDPLSARLGEHDGNYDSVEDRALLGPALATLPAREQSILRMRFVEGLTQSEIAVAVGVSQMHVSRLLSSSLQKLREGIGQTEAGPQLATNSGSGSGVAPEKVAKLPGRQTRSAKNSGNSGARLSMVHSHSLRERGWPWYISMQRSPRRRTSGRRA